MGALNLDAVHAVARVLDHFQIFFVDRGVKAGPSAAGFELRSGTKKLRVAADAMIRPVIMQVPVLAGERRLRATLASDMILLRRELFFPFFLGLLHNFSLPYTRKLDPIRLFKKWFEAAESAGLKEPNAMTLATATFKGKPSARMVLLKAFDRRGFVFYTNYKSRKGRELAENPYAALVFFWQQPLERQIRITGRVTKVTAEESDDYFHSRPLGSQFSASISNQSSVIGSRAVLLRKLKKIEEKYPNGNPPRPNHWGGFRVHPSEIEFWQGGKFRLHDRVRYRLRRDGSWSVDRLSP